MVSALLDTNIIIGYLRGHRAAEEEFARYPDPAISVVTRIEVLAGVSQEVETVVRDFLDELVLVSLDDDVAERAVHLRRRHKVKLPDAIVWASAQVHRRLLVTRNTKDYPRGDPGIRIPYTVQW
jgi:predicted nucleic acid-binding protein